MTDSDWVAYENKLKVTWYKEGICNVCGTEKKPFHGTLYTKNQTFWIKTENNKMDSLMICEKCIDILFKLIKIAKGIPKAERSISQEVVERNKKEEMSERSLKVFTSPMVWKVPDIQRRYLKEELSQRRKT